MKEVEQRRDLIQSLFYPCIIVSTILLTLVISEFGGIPTGVKYSYPVVAILGIYLVDNYYLSSYENNRLKEFDRSMLLVKIALILVVVSVPISLLTYDRVLSMIVLLFGVVLLLKEVPNKYVAYSLPLFALGYIVITYLSSGMYYGNVDPLWQHYEFVRNVGESGLIASINSSYSNFPGLHVTGSMIKIVGSLSGYPASLLTLFPIISGIYLFVFLNAKAIAISRYARYVIISFLLLWTTLFFSGVFFPQNGGFLFSLALTYTILKTEQSLEITIIQSVIICGFVVTHHYSAFIFMMVLAAFILIPAPRISGLKSSVRRLTLLFIVSFLFYWSFLGNTFLSSIFSLVITLTQAASPSLASGGIIPMGVETTEPTIKENLRWLFGPIGVYFTGLVGLGILGVRSLLEDTFIRRSILLPPYIIGILGIASAILSYPSPISFKTDIRVSALLSLFLALLLGIALWSIENRTERNSILSLLLAILVITAPIAALKSDPSYRPTQKFDRQSSYTVEEVSSLSNTGKFISRTDANVTTTWVDREFLDYQGVVTYRPNNVNQSGVFSSTDLFLYRKGWSLSYVSVDTRPFLKKIVLSEEYLSRSTNTCNNIFDNGEVGILYNTERQFLSRSNCSA
ncbi:hypothetical protein [Haloarcula sp. CBA1131]|uniref:hypothetical protein n=1 Tax=Haloarcula sp. CBA1131 TaxID=1853686 RepID=UPI00124401C0|nr:hypothetical protein [Haloarcula sp. CBA1131]